MPDFKVKEGLGESSPSASKKSKFKFDKKTILIVGGIGIVVIVLFTKLFKSGNGGETVEYVGTAYGDEYGTNGVDTVAQMQSLGDGIMKNVAAMIQDSNSSTMDNVTGSLNKLMEENNKRFESVLTEQEKKFETISSGNTDMYNAITQNMEKLQKGIQQNQDNITGIVGSINKPVTTPTPSPTPSTTTPTDVKPKLTPEENQRLYLTNLINGKDTSQGNRIWAQQELNKMNGVAASPTKAVTTPVSNSKQKLNTSTSIVDLLKSKGIDSSMDNRKKLASELGIKNYKGTAAQNTQMIKLVNNKK